MIVLVRLHIGLASGTEICRDFAFLAEKDYRGLLDKVCRLSHIDENVFHLATIWTTEAMMVLTKAII